MKNVLKLFIVSIAFISFSCSKDDDKTTTETSFYKPSGVITQERATELSNAWAQKNAALFSKGGDAKFDDEIKSLSWSLEDLRNYLDYAEHEAEKKEYKMTGVRVYLAAYLEKGGQNTLFFAPIGHTSKRRWK